MLRFKDTKKEWRGEAIAEVRHPRNIEQLWTDAELDKIGLERFTPSVEAPQPRRQGASRELLAFFSEDEQENIVEALNATKKGRRQLHVMAITGTVDLDDLKFRNALNGLAQAGAIPQAKVDALLTGGFQ